MLWVNSEASSFRVTCLQGTFFSVAIQRKRQFGTGEDERGASKDITHKDGAVLLAYY